MWKKFVFLPLLAIVIVAGCSKTQPAPASGFKVPAYIPLQEPPVGAIRASGIGEQAPDFRYLDSDGQVKSLSELRGKPVLLNFWASWCPPCRAEMPLIEEVYRKQQAKGVEFLTISIDEDPSKALQFMSDNGYTFPFLLDTKQSIADAYNVYAIPSTFFINKDGVILMRKTGAFRDKAELEYGLNKVM